jgi:hypothetical protein
VEGESGVMEPNSKSSESWSGVGVLGNENTSPEPLLFRRLSMEFVRGVWLISLHGY